MSRLEILIRIADEKTLDLVRDMVGREELALLIAKSALVDTTEKISPTRAAKVLEMTPDGARKKIENTAIKNIPASKTQL